MKISELEKHLRDIREGHGDNEIFVSDHSNLVQITGIEAAFISEEDDKDIAIIYISDKR